jgi:predicted nucleic acid-binding protein
MEIAGALGRRLEGGESEPDDAEKRCQQWLAELGKGLLTLKPDREALPSAITFSTKLMQPLQDCLYRAVAIHCNGQLITADRTVDERPRPLYK